MTQRLDLTQTAPDGIRAVLALEQYVRRNVAHRLFEMVKLRASMVNGCAYCVDMHSTDLLAAGEDVRRVVAVSAWRESTFFSDEERAALDLTDAVTRLGEGGVSDEVWDAARSHFDDTELAHLLLAIAVINVWNRTAITTHVPAPPLAAHA